jgi:phosphate transport system substrate-binding protein
VTLHRSSRLAAVLAAGSLALTACGGSEADEPSGTESEAAADLSGTLAGAGASSQTSAMEAWVAGFQTENEGVTINYDPVGSGGGRDAFTEGGVDFAGSDRAMDAEEITAASARCAEGASVVNLPLYISPIAVAFNLEGVDALNLSPATIAKIFNQKITTWNDPAIAADNPDAQLPDTAITPVNRSDDSGTTENFTEYLAATAAADWPYEPDGVFPVEGGEAANGTSGVVQAIQAGDGAIGYADASQVGELGVAAIGVGDGFVEYSPERAAAVVEASPREEGREEGDIAIELARDTTSPDEYPLVLVSYSLACTEYEEAEKNELVKAFLGYIASEEGQATAAENAGSAPISEALRTEVVSSIEAIGGA